MTVVAPGVHRLGTRWVNWYLVATDEGVTVVDTGLPGYRGQLAAALAAAGRSVDEVSAVVLTHWHADHTGTAESIRARTGAPVWAPAADAALVRGEERPPVPNLVGHLWRPAILRYLGHVVRRGGMRPAPVAEVRTYADGEALDVPGRPRVIGTPGHTEGHSSLLLEDRGVLFAGDALATVDVTSWSGGPRPLLSGVNQDDDAVLASLRRLESVDADLVLAGHGEPWTRGAAAAARHALDAGIP